VGPAAAVLAIVGPGAVAERASIGAELVKGSGDSRASARASVGPTSVGPSRTVERPDGPSTRGLPVAAASERPVVAGAVGAGDRASAGVLGGAALRTASRGRTGGAAGADPGAAAVGTGAALSGAGSGADRATGGRRTGAGERWRDGSAERRSTGLGAEGSLRCEGGDEGGGSGTCGLVVVSRRCFGVTLGSAIVGGGPGVVGSGATGEGPDDPACGNDGGAVCVGGGLAARRRPIRLGATGAGWGCIRGGGAAGAEAAADFLGALRGASASAGPVSRRSRRAANDGRLGAGVGGGAGALSSAKAGGGRAGLAAGPGRGAAAGRASRPSRRVISRGRTSKAGCSGGGVSAGAAAFRSLGGDAMSGAGGGVGGSGLRSGGRATCAAGPAGRSAFGPPALGSRGVVAVGREAGGKPEGAPRTRLSVRLSSPDFGFGFAGRGSAAATAGPGAGAAGIGAACFVMRWTAGRRRRAAGCARRGVTTGLATGSRGATAGRGAGGLGASTTAGPRGSASGCTAASCVLSGAVGTSGGAAVASTRGASGGGGVGAGATGSAAARWTRGGGVGAPAGLLATRKRGTSSTWPRGTGASTWMRVFSARRCSFPGAVRAFGAGAPVVRCRGDAGALSARASGGEAGGGAACERACVLAINSAESDTGIAPSGSSSPKIHCAAKSLRPGNEIGSGFGGSRRR
jgi:hypothetical protein